MAGLWEGLSPYDRSAIFARFGEYTHFVYPIFVAPLLLPLIAFELPTALVLFGLLHVAGWAALVWLWRLLLPIDWRLLALLLPVGFGAAAIHDLCSSNVVVFEAIAIWFAILLLWRGRSAGFAAGTVVAALPKLLWMALLPLVGRQPRAAWRPLLGIVAALLLSFAAWFLLGRDSLREWLSNLRLTTHIRYNVFTGLREIDRALGGETGEALWLRWEFWGAVLWLMVVGVVLVLVVRRGAGLRGLSLLAPLTLLVVWPGNLSYSWLVALPCAAAIVFFLLERRQVALALLLAFLLLLPQPVLDGVGLGGRFGYGTFLTVMALWLALAGSLIAAPQEFERWLEQAKAR